MAQETEEVALPSLETLDKSDATNSQLLDIIYELRDTVGPRVVNNAIGKVFAGESTSEKGRKERRIEQRKKQKRTKRKKAGREFNMNSYHQRYIALKFLYNGEKYAGFARQDHMTQTVENFLFDALIRTKLIEDIESCDYSRCGRTDRGVSAFGQVIALKIRSNIPSSAKLLDHSSIDDVVPGQSVRIQLESGVEKTIKEVEYATHLNRALPEDIKVYSACAVSPTFSARFDCRARKYRYYFVKGDMDIDAMQTAAHSLEGKHDYRNFCRIDPNCHTFEREILSFKVMQCPDQVAADDRQQVYFCEIYGRAFLWHQVRCMMQVLFFIGSGQESSDIVPTLLDIEKTPRRPQYEMAPDHPLVLHDCTFDDAIAFDYSPLVLHQVSEYLRSEWEKSSIQAAIARSQLDALLHLHVPPERCVEELDHFPKLQELMTNNGMMDSDRVEWQQVSPLLPSARIQKRQPLMSRETGDSVAERQIKTQERKKRRREMDEKQQAGKKQLTTNETKD